MLKQGLGGRLLLPFLAILGSLAPAHAFDIREGECRRILSGQERVRIHYASGLKAEVNPAGPDNIVSRVEVFPDGRREAHKWIGGVFLLENHRGRYIYADKDATRLPFAPGEKRQSSFTFIANDGATRSGTIVVAVETVEKARFGECEATYARIATTLSWAHSLQYAKVSRLFVMEVGSVIEQTVEQVKDGRPELTTFRATRIELIR